MRLRSICGLILVSDDPRRLADFYARVLGCTFVREEHGDLAELDATQVRGPHDEGFGLVTSYLDPDGNLFELVELTYDFAKSGSSADRHWTVAQPSTSSASAFLHPRGNTAPRWPRSPRYSASSR